MLVVDGRQWKEGQAQTDPALRDDFLRLENRWLELARSMEFAERLTDFSDEAKRYADKLPKAY